MAKVLNSNSNIGSPGISPAGRASAGGMPVAGPYAEPREEAGRYALRGKMLSMILNQSRSTGLNP